MKKETRNPFTGAQDVYLTKHKIAVTTTTNTSSKRCHQTVTVVKYYEQNDSNLKLLKKASGGTVRVGRTGTNYKQI